MDQPVHLLATERGMRAYVTAPKPSDTAAWTRALEALRSADVWGSTDAHGTPEIWAEIREGEQP
ncbi:MULTISPECIES: hypothetical protein [Streptomyces]|uniref:Uncharacterized protein n=2 Tax=Streptomyces TaxID=1883 RepID=A0A2U9P232_STRAS|nr:hypothetical protein [Streptomyces actuosus]AWT43188.1 hypothetical protein DMT42_13225 [Streptomyces actuosus]MBM4824660.1 hypothetical protein [Streptomyces actuosus]